MKTVFAWVMLAFFVLLPSRGDAQPGAAIRGRILDDAGRPVASALTRLETGGRLLGVETRTDSLGRFSLAVSPSTAELVLVVNAIGFSPGRRALSLATGTATLDVGDIRLTTSVTRLPTTAVSIPRRPRAVRGELRAFAAGSDPPAQSGLSPVSGDLSGDLAASIGTLPGVTVTAGGFSVLGLDPSQNNIVINDLVFSGGTVPRDLFSSASLLTATADASRNGFSGAQLALSTHTTTAEAVGIRVTVDASPLQAAPRGLARGAASSNLQMSGSGTAGTQARSVAVAWQAGRTSAASLDLRTASFDALARLGVTPSVRDHLVGSAITLGVANPASSTDRTRDNGSVVATINAELRPEQSIGITIGANVERDHGGSPGALAIPFGSVESRSFGFWMNDSYTRYWRRVILHTQRFGASLRRTDGGGATTPAAFVTAATDDTTSHAPRVLIGGPTLRPGATTDWDAQWLDRLEWMSLDGKHRVRAQAQLRVAGFEARRRVDAGTFSFASIPEFATGRPTSFQRDMDIPSSGNSQLTTSLSLTDAWTPSSSLQFTGGVALDFARFLRPMRIADARSPALGALSAQLPRSVTLSPRIGATWNFGRLPPRLQDEPFPESRGSVGASVASYRGTLSARMIDPLVRYNAGGRRIVCFGAATPVPPWDQSADPGAQPGCAPSTNPLLVASVPSVGTFAPGYTAPASIRASGFIRAKLSASTTGQLRVTHSLNSNLPRVEDLNLRRVAAFTISDEANRPVFVGPESILSETGQPVTTASRVDPIRGTVSLHHADLRSRTTEFVAQATRRLYASPLSAVTVAYSYLAARQQVAEGSETTAGDPRNISWIPSASDAQHQVTMNLDWATSEGGLQAQLHARVASGGRYTARISGDANGDGFFNDRAFIFAPNAARDRGIERDLLTLLQSAPAHARVCIETQMGSMAAPNACRGPWTTILNARVSARLPERLGGSERARIGLVVSNLAAGLDLLFHGSDGARGWGQSALTDPVLLTVRGFDPAARRFTYAVNPRFGSSVAPAIGWNPVRATVDTRFEIGPDPRRRRLDIIIRGGTQRPADARLNERELLDRLVGIAGPTAINLPALRPDLDWSTEQRGFWRALKDTVLAHDREAFAPVARYLASLPTRYDAAEVERRIRAEYEASGARYREAVAKLNRVLETRQRASLSVYLLRELDPDYVAAKRAGSWR